MAQTIRTLYDRFFDDGGPVALSETERLRCCGLLTLPVLAWNVIVARFLPPSLASLEFECDIPRLVADRCEKKTAGPGKAAKR